MNQGQRRAFVTLPEALIVTTTQFNWCHLPTGLSFFAPRVRHMNQGQRRAFVTLPEALIVTTTQFLCATPINCIPSISTPMDIFVPEPHAFHQTPSDVDKYDGAISANTLTLSLPRVIKFKFLL